VNKYVGDWRRNPEIQKLVMGEPKMVKLSALDPTETAKTKELFNYGRGDTKITAGRKVETPILISEKGTVFDGHTRIRQAVLNGEKEIPAYITPGEGLYDKTKSQLTAEFNAARGNKALGIAGTAAATTGVASSTEASTLGQKNNNPINLKVRDKKKPWDGTTGYDKQGHAQFENIDMGIRAALKNLKNHKKAHPNQTLIQYLRTFAQANSKAEAKFIAKALNITINTQLKKIDMEKLLIPMAQFESKTKLTPAQVKAVKEKFNL